MNHEPSRTAFVTVLIVTTFLLLGIPNSVLSASFSSNTLADTYHLLTVPEQATGLGTVSFSQGSQTASGSVNVFDGATGDTYDTTSSINKLNNYSVRSDGTFRGNAGSDTPFEGVVADTLNSNVWVGINPTTNQTGFSQGDGFFAVRQSQNLNSGDTIDVGDSRFIGAGMRYEPDPSWGSNPFAAVGISSVDLINADTASMRIKFWEGGQYRIIPGPNRGSDTFNISLTDTGALSLDKTETITIDPDGPGPLPSFNQTISMRMEGAVSPDTAFFIMREDTFASAPSGSSVLAGVRPPDDGYSLSDLRGYYTVIRVFSDSATNSLKTQQGYLEAGLQDGSTGKWSLFKSIAATTADQSGTFVLNTDTEARGGTKQDSFVHVYHSDTTAQNRLYLSANNRYFVMLDKEIKDEELFLGFRLPTLKDVRPSGFGVQKTFLSGSSLNGTVRADTGASGSVPSFASGEIGPDHPWNSSFSNYRGSGVEDRFDTAFGSGVTLTPDRSTSSDSTVVCVNSNGSDTSNYLDFVPVIYEPDTGWVEISQDRIVSQSGANVCFKPPHFSTFGVAGAEGVGSSSSSGGCLIERMGTPGPLVDQLRWIRDRMMNTAPGRWFTQKYYEWAGPDDQKKDP